MLRKSKDSAFVGVCLAVTLVLSLFSAGSVSAQATTHTITVTPPVNGTIKPGGAVVVADGANKRFTITPASNYHVGDVLVDGGSVYGQLTWDTVNKKIAYYKFVGVTTDHTIEAFFFIDTKTLSVSKSGTGTGTVTSDVAGIDCGVDCSEAYNYGTPVVLTAAPDLGAAFQGWLVGGTLVSKASTYPVTMNKMRSVVAKFLKTYSLNLSMAGGGTGGISGTLVSGKDFDHGVYKAGSIVAVKATPGAGSSFAGWSGDASGAAKKITVTMNADKNITASFNLTSALKIAEKVSVVEAKLGATGPLKIGLFGAIGPPTCPDDIPYCNDKTSVYVEESSAQTFNTINEILCKMAQAKYDEMLNKGPYKAQIDVNLCKSGKDSASGAGQDSQNQSSGAGMPNYEMWTLESSRVDDSSPQIVKAWIHQKGSEFDPDMLISARVVITEGVSEENPYGLFTVNFKGNPVMNGQVISFFTLMKGFMKTEKDLASGKVLLKFTSKFDTTTVPPEYGVPPMTWIDRATLDKRADGTGKGTAYLYEYENFGQGQPREDEVTFNFTFDPDYFHKMEVGDPLTEMCLDRNNFAASVWSYGLYNPDGTRVNRNSGFSVMKTVVNKDYYGWIGYWGIWFPDEVTINNDDTVYKVTYGPGGTEVPYTVLKSGGKLKKYTLKPLTLFDIKNVPLDYSLGQGPQSTMYRVKWDGSDFTIFAKFDPMTGVWGPLEPLDPTTIDLSSLSYDMLYFYSQALNGMVQVKLNYEGGCTPNQGPPPTFSCPASDSTPVNSYTQDVIYPSDILPAELVCFGNCPDPAKLTSTDPFNHYDQGPQLGVLPADPDSHATYTFDTANMVLMSGATPVITTNPAQNFQWGIMSGPLFDPQYLDLLACEMMPGDPNPDSTCGWKTWSELPEYYVWETGPNSWNQFTALKDPSTLEVLEFEPPLLVSYVHTWLDLTTSMFYLEYSGFGNLNGIPGKCVDPDTGDEMPCGPDSRWVPEFNIAEGSEVDDAVSGTPYFVKPLEMEQRMKPTETLGPCGNLPLTTYPLPSLSDFVDPNIGSEPVVEGPPAVIGGEIQQPEV